MFWKKLRKFLCESDQTDDNTKTKTSTVKNKRKIKKNEKQKDSFVKYAQGDVIFENQSGKKTVKQVLSDKGRGLVVKEITVSKDQEYNNICEGLVDLIKIASIEYKHPNLVKYINASYDGRVIRIVTEKMPLDFEDMPFSHEGHIKIYFKQVLKAMRYLHSKKIYNINLKPNNILVNGEGVLKIRDYIGKPFFDILTSESSEDYTNDDKRNDIYRDIMSLIKLMRILVYDKEIEILNNSEYFNFMRLLERFAKIKSINLKVLLKHTFLETTNYSKINYKTKPVQHKSQTMTKSDVK